MEQREEIINKCCRECEVNRFTLSERYALTPQLTSIVCARAWCGDGIGLDRVYTPSCQFNSVLITSNCCQWYALNFQRDYPVRGETLCLTHQVIFFSVTAFCVLGPFFFSPLWVSNALIKVVVSQVGFCCVSRVCAQDSWTVVEVCVWVCVESWRGDSWVPLSLPALSQWGCGCWSVTSLSPTRPPPPCTLPPSPCSVRILCLWPLFCLSSNPDYIWDWSAMETCTGQLEAVASWASFSLFPFLLSRPATFLSVPLQWLHAPASHNQSLTHAHNHAKLMGTVSPCVGWKQRFVTHLPLREHRVRTSMLLHPHTQTVRETTLQRELHFLPCQMLRFVFGLSNCLY